MSAAALEIRGLEKHFKGFALGPLDLTVPTGSIYAFIGPNGAGKTTTLDLIFGMGAKRAGAITVLGLDHVRDEVAMKAQVGYVSPESDYRAWGRVQAVIRFVRSFYPSWDDEYCDRLMRLFGLAGRDWARTLSFGARMKLGLVLALSWRPKVLILDEPTVGLDAVAKQAVFAELLEIVQDPTRTVVISSHGLTDLERLADHVGMIRNGRMVFEGPMASVLDRFHMVDFSAVPALGLVDAPGWYVQSRDETRMRVLLDRDLASADQLRRRGAQEIADVPVTLEEIFVALAKG
jgi:ABC-2 type transport system ATP-binding protein